MEIHCQSQLDIMLIFRWKLAVPVTRVWTCCIQTCRLEHTEDVETCACGHPRCQGCVYDNEAILRSRVTNECQSFHSLLIHGRYCASAINLGQGLIMYGPPERYYCCNCRYGPMSVAIDTACINCGHQACSYCMTE